MNLKAFSELLASWEFREESEPIQVVCDIVRLTHMFVSTHEDWERATPSDFLRYVDTVAAAVTKRNGHQTLTPDERQALSVWDDAGAVPVSKQWDSIPQFRKIQFDDGRISTACQLLSRIQRYENAGQSERQCLLLSIGFLSARLVRLQNRIVEDPAGKRPARVASPSTESGTRTTREQLRPISRRATAPVKSATPDATVAVEPAARELTGIVKHTPREAAKPGAPTQRDREDFAKVLHAREEESRVPRTRRIPEDELRAALANPTPGKTALLSAASHFGVTTKTIRRRAEEFGIDL